MSMQERWYQAEAEDSIYNHYRYNSGGNPIVAMPTGTGKSVVIGKFATNALRRWPTQRFAMLTHVKELIEQNANKLLQVWPNAPLGIYSAGVGRKESGAPILYGGVQSVVKDPAGILGHRDVLMIDECQLLSPNGDTMYQAIISELRKINPRLVIVGFSATPFRMGQGSLTNAGLFTNVCYNLCTIPGFQRLIAEGFLVAPVPKRTSFELDVSDVGMSAGDYNLKQVQDAVNTDQNTYDALSEAAYYGRDRQSWMVFASGVEHAEACCAVLNLHGVPTTVVHSRVAHADRVQRLEDYKAGRYRCIVGNNILTTGFDHPPLDLIIMLRPTMSSVLWVQMLGRGTRPYDPLNPGDVDPRAFPLFKHDCLVLDFAGNTRRLGPINDPVLPRAPNETGGGGGAPYRICRPEDGGCNCFSHARAVVCEHCGMPFTAASANIENTADTAVLLKSDLPQVEYFTVQKVLYQRWEGRKSGTPSLKVTYICGVRGFNKFVTLEADGWGGKSARDWWRQHHASEPPETVDDALLYTDELKIPSRVRVWVNKKYPEVLGYEF